MFKRNEMYPAIIALADTEMKSPHCTYKLFPKLINKSLY